jgi:DNA-binding response OmpR family regulator
MRIGLLMKQSSADELLTGTTGPNRVSRVSRPSYRRVLVCDRNAFIAYDLEAIIAAQGYDVDVCVAPISDPALYLQEHDFDFALVEFIRGDCKMRRALIDHQLPFALVTSLTLQEIFALDRSAPVLVKPFTTDEVWCVLDALSAVTVRADAAEAALCCAELFI